MKFDILRPLSTSGTGRKAIQEDSVFPALGEATLHDKLFIVADGHGGDGKGFVASECFCQAVSDFFFQNTCPDEPFTDEMLEEALQQAATAMERRCPDSEGIGYALLYLHRHGVLAANVGNSLIYHVRPKERAILYRSAVDGRTFSPTQGEKVQPTRAHIVNVQYGDYFVLLTEGAGACISDSSMQEILCEPVNDNTKLMRMVKMLSDCPDNYSITIVHVSGVMSEALDERLVGSVVTASQVASPVNGGVLEEQAVCGDTQNAIADIPAERKDKTNVSRKDAPRTRPQQDGQTRRPYRRNEREDRRMEEDKDGFPVVLVTALLIVALGFLAWWWMRRSTQRTDIETPAIEVKKDSVKKDTMNIMKGERPKPLDLQEEKKKEETKPEQPKQRQEAASETMASESENAESPMTVPAAESESQPQPQQPQSQQPEEEFKSEVTPVTTPEPGTVTPRPVIPEDE